MLKKQCAHKRHHATLQQLRSAPEVTSEAAYKSPPIGADVSLFLSMPVDEDLELCFFTLWREFFFKVFQ